MQMRSAPTCQHAVYSYHIYHEQPRKPKCVAGVQNPPPPELPPRTRAMGVDEEVVHQLMQEIITGSADVQEVAAEQIRCSVTTRHKELPERVCFRSSAPAALRYDMHFAAFLPIADMVLLCHQLLPCHKFAIMHLAANLSPYMSCHRSAGI